MDIPQSGLLDSRLCLPSEAALLKGFELFRLRGEDCPYFYDGRPRESINFMASEIDPAVYEALLPYGWRRCGVLFYKSLCPSCSDCRPLRIDAALFTPDRTQRRCAELNKDLEIAIDDPSDDDADFELFSRYCASRHEESVQKREDFRLFLASPPLPAAVIRYKLPGGKLVCSAWIDVLPSSLSAVYTAFDPEMPKRGLGTFSILMQMELCRKLGFRHLHLGFHILDCRKMSYKNRFRPNETASMEGVWLPS